MANVPLAKLQIGDNILGPLGWAGKSSMCFADGPMNSNGSRAVLKDHLIDIGNSIGRSDWIFQEDNGPVHRLKVNITMFKSQKINVLR